MATKLRKRRKAKAYVPTATNAECYAFARLCATCGSMAEAGAAARAWAANIRGPAFRGGWKYYLLRFAAAMEAGRPFGSVFKLGNIKLRCNAFSTLPVVTCPGAGACAGLQPDGTYDLKEGFCYSIKAWRYPAAFFRQCSNTLLLRFNRRAVITAFQELPQGDELRLYVDGDIDSDGTALFWFNLLRQRPDIRCYGYSKSWDILARLARFVPPNYVLNLSSGGIHDGDGERLAHMLGLPFVRGHFVAVPTKKNHGKGRAKYESRDYHRDVRESAAAAGFGKVFSCGGTCGTACTNQGSACGIITLKVPVAIGIH